MSRQRLASLLLTFLLCTAGFTRPLAKADSIPDPLIAEMISQVKPETLYAYTGDLSGEWPVYVHGEPYRITTRATASGLPLQNAAYYVYEHLASLGLLVSYQNWAKNGYTGRNVIGELTGTTRPDEIILLTAHLDDNPSTGLAPGADDNASGSAGLLLAADILSGYRFDRSVRFVFFTGEEQGLYGSRQYASEAADSGENIQAVINLDMIAWDGHDAPAMRVHTRSVYNAGYPADLELAITFVSLIYDYGLDGGLMPVIDPDGASSSDHASFWDAGYPAILVIEDDQDDFNPNYHSMNDRLSRLNLAYFSGIVKAAVGMVADLAQPLGRVAAAYAARLDPPADMHWGIPGDVTAYSLGLTNTGSMPDSYTFSLTQNDWPITLPGTLGPLAVDASANLSVTVSIPANAAGGAFDRPTISITSANTGATLDETILITVVELKKIYLPAIAW